MTHIKTFLTILVLLLAANGVAQQRKVVAKAAIENLPSKKYRQCIRSADSLFAAYETEPFDIDLGNGMYESGLGSISRLYRQALELKPNNPYPAEQLETVKLLLDKEERQHFDREYGKVVGAADKALAEKNFPKALELYRRAVAFRPSDPYPQEKVKEVEALMKE